MTKPKRKPKPKRSDSIDQAHAAWSGKRQALLDELPKHDWNWVKAGLAAGYSPTYAMTTLKRTAISDPNFCKAVLDRRKAIEAGSTDRRTQRLADLDRIIAHTKLDRDRIKAIEVQGRMCGWLSETIVHEPGQRMRELAESEQAEARRLATERFQTCNCLPPADIGITHRSVGEIMEAEIIQSEPKQGSNDAQAHANLGTEQGKADDSMGGGCVDAVVPGNGPPHDPPSRRPQFSTNSPRDVSGLGQRRHLFT